MKGIKEKAFSVEHQFFFARIPNIMYRLQAVQELPISIEKAWDFYSNPKNLAVITPDNLGFQIRTDLPDRMYPGMMIVYTVKPLLGIPMTWVTEITQMRQNELFIDEQRIGPYQMWHHQHIFEEIDGGVRMTDIVDYQLPLAPFGNIGHFVVKGELKKIFGYRVRKTEELFGKKGEADLRFFSF